MKKKSFENRVVIITGSSKGIGKEVAIQLSRLGAKVVLNGRNNERLNAAKRELEQIGIKTFTVQADITSIGDCNVMMDAVIGKYGKIDILINNGSLTMNEQIDNLDPKVFTDVLNSNSMGAAIPTMAALPHIKNTKGSVIFISSLAGLHGLPSASAYSAGKMSLTALWQSLKIELSRTGIHFGICYVSFTKNDQDKMMLSSNGKLVPVPPRPSFIQQSQAKVAATIIRQIKHRRSKVILSWIGKISAFLMRHFPRLVLFLIVQFQKKSIRKMQPTSN